MDRLKFVVKVCWPSWAMVWITLAMLTFPSVNKASVMIGCVAFLLMEQIVLALSKFKTTQRLQAAWDAGEMLWVMLANVSGGNWSMQSAEWQKYAGIWRDNFHKQLPHHTERSPKEPVGPSMSFQARRVT